MSELSEKIERLEDINETWTRVLKEMSRSFSSDLFDMVQGIAFDPNYVILHLLEELADRRKNPVPSYAYRPRSGCKCPDVYHEDYVDCPKPKATTYDERDMRKQADEPKPYTCPYVAQHDRGFQIHCDLPAGHEGRHTCDWGNAYEWHKIGDGTISHATGSCSVQYPSAMYYAADHFYKLREQMVDLGLLSEQATDQMAFIVCRDFLNDHAEQEKQSHNDSEKMKAFTSSLKKEEDTGKMYIEQSDGSRMYVTPSQAYRPYEDIKHD